MLSFVYFRAAVVSAVVAALTLSSGLHQRAPRQFVRAQSNSFPSAVFNSGERVLEDDSNLIFYSVRPDFRRCVAPLCGGYFVKAVNQSHTRCADKRFMAECYVAEIDWNGQPQVEVARVLIRGSMIAKHYGSFGNIGELRVTESWQAAGDKAPLGSFYRVRDRGIRCITFPCPTHLETKLNSTLRQNIAGVDLSRVGAGADLIRQASTAMTGGDGLVVAGNHRAVTGPGGRSVTLEATQFYLRAGSHLGAKPPVVTKPPAMKSCIKTGCSGQVCADHDVITTCEWRPEYACYKKARCEHQADGNCGFTRTPELTACLAGK